MSTEISNPSTVMTWQKRTVPYTALQTAAVTNNTLVLALPVGGIIHRALLNVTQAFAGTTTLTLSLGTAGDNVKFITAQSALSTGVLNGVALSSAAPESMASSTNINLYAISTIQNLSSLSQGSVDVYVLTSLLP